MSSQFVVDPVGRRSGPAAAKAETWEDTKHDDLEQCCSTRGARSYAARWR
mgnify:CR=1 FL=1